MPSIEEKEIYIPEDWARVVCHGLGWADSEGELDRIAAEPLLNWIKANYPSIAEEHAYLF